MFIIKWSSKIDSQPKCTQEPISALLPSQTARKREPRLCELANRVSF